MHFIASQTRAAISAVFVPLLFAFFRNMKALKILQESFPYYLHNDRKNTLLSLGVALCVMVVMIMFHPAHLRHMDLTLLITGVIFVVLYVCIIWFPRFFPEMFDPLNWTIGKYILFTLWQCFVIGIFCSVLIYVLNYHPSKDFLTIMGTFYASTVTYGSFSIIIATFVIREYMLKQSLQSAIHANQELERIRHIRVSHENQVEPVAIVIRSETSETAEFCLPDLLYIEADDNYATLHWKNEHGYEKKMLRVNLKSIETQLNNAYIIRCHRSYIVNIHAITHVRGNTNGYKLDLRNTDFAIPVSRSKGKEVIDKIEQIRSVAESA
jgi:hypothetical protein